MRRVKGMELVAATSRNAANVAEFVTEFPVCRGYEDYGHNQQRKHQQRFRVERLLAKASATKPNKTRVIKQNCRGR